jgi:FtsZ-binding cell division protein ZapB
MDFLLSQFPHTALGWGGLIIGLGFAAVAAYLTFKQYRGGQDDRLINILKDTVEELEKKVDQQDRDIKLMQAQVSSLQTTNDTLTRVLQGRDTETIEFQRRVDGAVIASRDTNEKVTIMAEQMIKLMGILERHMTRLEAGAVTN